MIWCNIAFLIFLIRFHGTSQMHPIQFASEDQNKPAMVTIQVETSMIASRFNYEGHKKKVNISEECYKVGYCEHVEDYPEELAEKLLHEMQEHNFLLSTLHNNPKEKVSIASRFGEEQIETEDIPGENPCEVEKKTIKPRLLRDNGKWYQVLNPKSGVQMFDVELCKFIRSPNISKSCSGDNMYINAHFSASCEQKYMYYNVNIIVDKRVRVKTFKMPCCCSCVGIRNYGY